MFTSKEEGFSGTTVIAEGVHVDGNFQGDGPMIIDGIVKGLISTSKTVEIGHSANIEANIKAGSVIIAGHVKGNISAKDRLELVAGSRVEGDVSAKILVIAEGAILNGKCNMSSSAITNTEENLEQGSKEKNLPKKLATK